MFTLVIISDFISNFRIYAIFIIILSYYFQHFMKLVIHFLITKYTFLEFFIDVITQFNLFFEGVIIAII